MMFDSSNTARKLGLAATMAILICGIPFTALAEEEKDTRWKDTAELSLVVTSGNAEGETFGFKNTLSREWDRSAVVIKAGGIRVNTTSITRTPVAPDPLDPLTFSIVETKDSQTTAENYYLNGRYDREISETLLWFAGIGWDRNRFAGIQNRYIAEGGVANVWYDREDMKFKTSYSITYTKQEDLVELPGADDNFIGGRFSWEYLNKLWRNAEYTNSLVVDENFEETSDWRADMTNALSVAMSERMALKVSLQLLYDNMPSFDLREVVDGTGVGLGEFVPVEFDELDTIFTASLVINF